MIESIGCGVLVLAYAGHDERGGDLRDRFLGLFGALALVQIEELLAQRIDFGVTSTKLVVLDIGERLFQVVGSAASGAPPRLSTWCGCW